MKRADLLASFVAFCVALLFNQRPCFATEAPSPAWQAARAGLSALEEGAVSRAVDQFELASDLGAVHPALSYNRALAYLLRARSAQANLGDLGQAAAGLEEALLQAPKDDEVRHLLSALRNELDRRRAKAGGEAISSNPSLARAVVTMAPREVWDGLALAGSMLLTVALLLRTSARRSQAVLALGIAMGLGVLLLLVGGGLSLGARHLAQATGPAVVVVKEAPLLMEQGLPEAGSPAGPDVVALPEGALVYVRKRSGNLVQVEWGNELLWVLSAQLRLLQGG